MHHKPSRRDVLRASAAGAFGLALPVFGAAAKAPKSPQKVRFACIGVGGKGDSDTADANRLGVVVAICDADRNTLAAAMKKYPDARPFTDYRYMYKYMADSIDAVTVSTPDHNHGLATAMALTLGKHAFCQKPLTRTIWETRLLAELAQKNHLATQMGNQGTAGDELRRAAMAVKGGAIGTVKEVHVWTDRAEGWWPQGVDHPMPDVKPASVDWDSWLGPAPVRHFATAYHPFKWRGWRDFGTGALGDMGCHVLNLPFMALDLRDPVAVRGEVSDQHDETYPRWSIVHYEFAERKGRAPLQLTWYDGGKKPSQDYVPGVQYSGGGVIIVGSTGTLYVPGEHGGGATIVGKGAPQAEFEKSPGHFEEFINAIQGGKPAMSNFPGYACPLTETVLLGNLAVSAPGERLEWDAANMRVKGRSDLDHLLKPTFRENWSL